MLSQVSGSFDVDPLGSQSGAGMTVQEVALLSPELGA